MCIAYTYGRGLCGCLFVKYHDSEGFLMPYKSVVKCIRMLIGGMITLSVAFISMPTSGNAVPFTYEYAGSPFLNSATAPFTSAMTVTGTFTIDLPSITSLLSEDRKASITSFSMFDGVQTLDADNSTLVKFTFSTDSIGEMLSWRMQADGANGDFILARSTFGCFDAAQITITGQQSTACSDVSAGTVTALFLADVPEPTTLALFGIGLAGLAGMKRRNKTIMSQAVA